MAELIRKIEENDIPKLHELMKLVFNDGDWKDIQRLGGMTNHSYEITRNDGQEYLVRIPGEGTEELINRLDERKSTELACKLGIDSPLLYFGDDGRKVMKFIHDPQQMSEEVMIRRDNLLQAAEIFYKLHTCGIDTGVRFEVFEMADLYEKIIREGGVAFYDDYENVKKTVMEIKAEVDSGGEAKRVPCHNDSLVGNWVLDGEGRLYLVDWEYSGMNEPMWDLSCLSIEIGYSQENDEELLTAYFGRKASLEEKKRFVAAKLYVDYLWTLWGLTRVPFDGDFMQEYADGRYIRLKKNIDAYKKL
ncbi:choline/ethanolamine kinase family protein [Butyrivibrio fibrisolvens]|uniref:choline/ethanolamine kinase family protein n=1 Tax=Butyrivibrio fibrisolvens TaxID=831 RepID=UPI0003F84F2E|nr:choline/ethanolamine kinase family protein [Butyrivibrio fibrisolvens]